METTITKDQLLQVLATIKGAKIVGVEFEGEPTKEGLTKRNCWSVMLNARYAKAKAKRLGEQYTADKVSVQAKTWRSRVADTPVLRHNQKGTLYLETLRLSGHTNYKLHGKDVERKDVEHLLKNRKTKPVVPYYTTKIDNIKSIKVDGTKYNVV